MHVGWLHVAMAGAWGALVGLERRAFLQAMFCRPLVAATGMGLLLGQTQTGLYLGMVLELFYLGTANLGAALPENDTLAASGTAAAAATMAAAHRRGRPRRQSGASPSSSSRAWAGLGRLVDRKVEVHGAAGLSAHGLELAEAGSSSAPCGRTCSASGRTRSSTSPSTPSARLLGVSLGALLSRGCRWSCSVGWPGPSRRWPRWRRPSRRAVRTPAKRRPLRGPGAGRGDDRGVTLALSLG